jgi:hypothetical protein
MSEISALAAANALSQIVLPLIQAASIQPIQIHPAPSSSTQDAVSISSEAHDLHGPHN